MSNDSTSKTLLVALVLCIVCSVIVSGAAVILRPEQQANKLLNKQKNILEAAGLMEKEADISELFSSIEKRVIDIDTGEYAGADFNVESYDQRKAKNDPKANVRIAAENDIAGLKKRAKMAEVYLVKNDQGKVETVILPISGYGLWSTLYGFLALESDLNTVAGLSFYDHLETPGLGGEVDNPKWKAQWIGKKIYNADGEVVAKLKKGGVKPSVGKDDAYSGASGAVDETIHQVDALSGATLTGNGVNNLLQYWMGGNGFGPFLNKLKMSQGH